MHKLLKSPKSLYPYPYPRISLKCSTALYFEWYIGYCQQGYYTYPYPSQKRHILCFLVKLVHRKNIPLPSFTSSSSYLRWFYKHSHSVLTSTVTELSLAQPQLVLKLFLNFGQKEGSHFLIDFLRFKAIGLKFSYKNNSFKWGYFDIKTVLSHCNMCFKYPLYRHKNAWNSVQFRRCKTNLMM